MHIQHSANALQLAWLIQRFYPGKNKDSIQGRIKIYLTFIQSYTYRTLNNMALNRKWYKIKTYLCLIVTLFFFLSFPYF